MTTDNLATEPTEMDLSQAAEAFANILEPKTDEPDDEQKTPPEEGVEAPVEDEEEVEEEPKFTVKVDGKEVEVKLSELKNGYQRQSDYTRKTTAVAEQAKAVEAEIQKTQQERTQFIQKLDTYAKNLQSVVNEQSNTDWQALLNSDPVEYLKQRHTFEERQAALTQVQREQQEAQQRAQAEHADGYKKYIDTQRKLLEEQLPEWKDTKKADAEKEQIRQYLSSIGKDEQFINSLNDHRDILLVRHAMLFDKLMKEAPQVTKKVEKLPAKVVKPGSTEKAGLDARTAAFKKLSQSGRVEDAAAVFATIL
jgi:hypothetical protein